MTPPSTQTPPETPRAGGERPLRVVLVNQYCYPDIASTGHLIHDLAIELAGRGLEVEVLTTQPSYGDKDSWVDCPKVQVEGGATFKRVWVPRVSKNVLAGRAIKDGVFLMQLGVRMLFGSRRDTVYLYSTAPPYGAIVGAMVGLVRKHTYVTLLYDSYPQLATWVGTFKKGSFIEKVWHRINRFFYGRAKQAIVLCDAAKRLVCENYPIDADRVHPIPNWAPPGFEPIAKHDTDFARRHAYGDEFVLLYSGNMGLYYDFETVLGAAELLKDEPFKLVIVGGGGKKADVVKQVADRNLTNTTVLPYQPFETLNDSLNACDASLVTIAEGIEGISFPSKLYTSLAVGKAIVAIAEDWSELREKVEQADCGVWAKLGDAEGLAEKLRGLIRDRARTAAMGERARELFEREYTREASASKYERVLRLADPNAKEGAR
ncbi:MAG: glycosyltransferase family 4 protein [Phycisphaeraceae bacterium]|nr:MAG: glycosyltransferase family 4 protein [Phycisphaeraceae bacterium]